jgi:SAM-dependent methyltransferase
MESPESWFHRRATLYVESQILFHLNQVGVLSFLSDRGAHTAPQIAASLHLEPGPTDALLDYVFEVDDLLERDHDGKYSLSDFGCNVVDRFSDAKSEGGPRSINMFDVRVGAYGPVWQNLGNLLSGIGQYGQDFHRDGRYAENGVSKLAMKFWPSLTEQIDEFAPTRIVELGLTTGLLERLAQRFPAPAYFGLDRSAAAIQASTQSSAALGVKNISWIQSDFYDFDHWCKTLDADEPGMIYSLHFHELMARGQHAFVEALCELRARLPDWVVVAFEQPRLHRDERTAVPETLWLYSQSNVLIHHLIGNGKILSCEAWIDLGHQAGCRKVTGRACNYLGYQAFRFQL